MLSSEVNLTGGVPGYAAVMETPGSRLRQLREMRNLTLEEVAAALRISPQALSQIELGSTKNVRPENLLNLCAYYDVDPYKLFLGKPKSEVASELRRRPSRTP